MRVRGERLAVSGTSLAVLLLAACAANPDPNPPAPADDPVTITILHINDVYEISPVEGGKTGGLARVATLLQRLRTHDSTTRMFLGGDFLAPSAIGTARVNGERLAGRQMVAVLNAAGLDLATFGNHEFDLGPAGLGKSIGAAVKAGRIPAVLAANTSFPGSDAALVDLQRLAKEGVIRRYLGRVRKSDV